jgi:hypothetical protein
MDLTIKPWDQTPSSFDGLNARVDTIISYHFESTQSGAKRSYEAQLVMITDAAVPSYLFGSSVTKLPACCVVPASRAAQAAIMLRRLSSISLR